MRCFFIKIVNCSIRPALCTAANSMASPPSWIESRKSCLLGSFPCPLHLRTAILPFLLVAFSEQSTIAPSRRYGARCLSCSDASRASPTKALFAHHHRPWWTKAFSGRRSRCSYLNLWRPGRRTFPLRTPNKPYRRCRIAPFGSEHICDSLKF